jgi:hypothetical protein
LVALLPDVPRHAEPLRPPPFFTGPAAGGYFVGPDTDGTPKFGPVGTRLSGWMTKIRLGWDRPTLVPELRRQLVADLVRWQVGTVVVGPMDPPATEATMVRFVSELLRAPPERVDGVWVWWDVQPRSLGHQPTAGRC